MNGRKFLYTTAAMDRSARNQLTHTLAGTDSDLDGDIAAITINRWGMDAPASTTFCGLLFVWMAKRCHARRRATRSAA
jgi:hypothetical protein